jgi:hypothetical protein
MRDIVQTGGKETNLNKFEYIKLGKLALPA